MAGGLISTISPIGGIVHAVTTVGSAVVNGFKNFFGIHSPSRLMAKYGALLDEGLAVGITNGTNGVVNEVKTMSKTVAGSMISIFSDMDNIAEPSIRPVLDLTSVKKGASEMSSLISRDSKINLIGDISSARKVIYPEDDKPVQNGNSPSSPYGNTYTFTQNNYSPKALSSSEIYRQTKNQFSMLKRG